MGTTFCLADISTGKQENKAALCSQFGLDLSKPLFSFIGRLSKENGADLLPAVVYKLLLKKEVSLLILGDGEASIVSELRSLDIHFTEGFARVLQPDESLVHQVYAGSDFLLMPYRVEPGALNLMYALRYGAIPVARRTGAIKDSLEDIGDGGFGICHVQASVKDVCDSVDRAEKLYKNKKKFNAIRKKGMQINHSWEKSAQEYLTLYKSLTP